MTIEEFQEKLTLLEHGVPKFSRAQVEYLQRIDISLPHYRPHVFYFELEKLT